MDEVPGEAVVIVDDEDHGAAIADAGRGATALARDGSALIVLGKVANGVGGSYIA